MESGSVPGLRPPIAEEPAESSRGGWKPADPGPLGLAGFALTTFVLSMFNAGLVSKAGEPVVLGVALAYGGIAQFAAGMWEFRTGNTFGAVAFTSFGAFWVSFWALITFFAPTIPPEHVGAAVGLYLISWGIFTAYMFVASLRTTAAIALVFILAFDGAVSFIPPLRRLTYGQLTSDMTDRIGGFGDPRNGLGVAILGTAIWCLILVVPGWLRFLRGDLK